MRPIGDYDQPDLPEDTYPPEEYPPLPAPPPPAPLPPVPPPPTTVSEADNTQYTPSYAGTRRPVPPSLESVAPTTIPSSFAHPASPASMRPFRSPAFGAERFVGGIPGVGGESAIPEDDDELQRYLLSFGR